MGRQKKELLAAVVLTVLAIGLGGYAQEISNFGPGATGDSPTFGGDVTALSLTTTGTAHGPTGITISSVPTYLGSYSSSGAALWLSNAAPTSANYILSNFGPTDLNTVAGQVIQFQVAGATKATMAANGDWSTSSYLASAASGFNAYAAQNNGARFDFGAGASDYASSDGTTVTFAGPVTTQALTATSGTFSGVVALNSGAGNILTLGSDQFVSWPAGGAKISGAGSGNLYESFGASTANIGGSLCVNTTGVGNLGASGPDDLQTCTISANTLVVTGRCFDVFAFGTMANNANAKTVRLTIGPTPTAIITKQLTVSVASTWKITATICRTGASAQSFVAEAYNFGGTAVTSVEAATDYDEGVTGTLTQTETNSLVIKTQSTVSTTDNDIVSSMLIVKAL